MNKPKILFIMHMPPPVHGAAMMGQYIHDSKLINERFDCHYINPSLSDSVSNVGKFSFYKIISAIKNIIFIIKEIKKIRPNLCYYTPTADGWGIYRDLLVLAVLKWNKQKIVLHMHNKGVAKFSVKHIGASFAYRHIFKGAKVILLARELYQDVRNYVQPDNVYYCPNGMPKTNYETFCRRTTNKEYTFLFLSNMIEEKGVIDVLRACTVLKGEGRLFKCQFVGKWSTVSKEYFNEIIEKYNIKDVVSYLGSKYGKEKVDALKKADALVFPTYYHGETFGLVLLEAMEYGLPCISTYEGGIPSVIDNENTGLLIRARDVEALVDKMRWLIEHPHEGLIMGEKGRKKFLKEFTLDIFEKRLSDILFTESNSEGMPIA